MQCTDVLNPVSRVEFFQDMLPPKIEQRPSEPIGDATMDVEVNADISRPPLQVASVENPRSGPIDDATIHAWISAYLARDDDEVATLKAERRPGRPPATRQTNLEQAIAAEKQEYESGLWMPDLRDGKNVDALRDWSGKWDAMGLIRFVRVFSSGKTEESAWPPRGAV